jgi:hypothetical protein
MAESLTISRETPALKSMDYALLRQAGIDRLQELAGSIWTDFNIHDPGVTVLEALAYAITDLGYRSGYRMQDILAQDPNAISDIKNFFTAREILPNCPLTVNDYRKLLMDVEVKDTVNNCTSGVKNAWLFKSAESEQKFYVRAKEDTLSYAPDPSIPGQDNIHLKGLYNVLLEFNECAVFGDLNENTLTGNMQITNATGYPGFDNNFLFRFVEVSVEFPRWDTAGVDWTDPASIRAGIGGKITLEFLGLPHNYYMSYVIDSNNEVLLSGELDFDLDGNPETPLDPTTIALIQAQINAFIYDPSAGLIIAYQKKVEMIFTIMKEVKRTLMANRNLCEDFFRFAALKVEEIAMCGDIEVTGDSDIETVLANIYHEVGKFLSPTVFFHSLDDMMARGKTPDEIFEGPRLAHGFIDDEELKKADLRKSIHVSDLYNIIMDIPGVVAIKNLQVANFPEDNDDNIPTKSVKWCLELAFDKYYVPRLSIERSNITFFKDLLPFQANVLQVEALLGELKSQDPPQRLEDPVLDLPVPQGEFKALDEYTSVQEEFPLVYGTGRAGLPQTASTLRKAQAHQLKGFLMIFDQLLADYLEQLANVRDLFSMNAARDNDGNFVIDRSYFAQTLFNIVPNAADLYVNSQPVHIANLDLMTEDKSLFESRRAKFLDHLLARFGESFSEYAMLTYTLSGPKPAEQLIEDRLEFLNNYPEVSSCRGAAFNYKEPCHLWHIDNVSGLERRTRFLLGLKQKKLSELIFFPGITIDDNLGAGPFTFTVDDPPSNPLMGGVNSYATVQEVNQAVEMTIVAGINFENYVIYSPGLGKWKYRLFCDGTLLTENTTLFNSQGAAELQVKNQVIPVLLNQFFNDPESNRKNLDCGILDEHLGVTITDDTQPGCPPSCKVTFSIKDDFGTVLINGEFGAFGTTSEVSDNIHDLIISNFLLRAADRDNYRFELDGSGDYVFSVTDTCRDPMATSAEKNFNDGLAAFILTANPAVTGISVIDQDGNVISGFTITASAASEDKISISVSPPLPGTVTGGKIKVDFTVSVTNMATYQPAYRRFTVDEDLRGLIREGDFMNVLIDGNPFTLRVEDLLITDFTPGSYKTQVTVFETLPATAATLVIDHSTTIPLLAITSSTTLVLKGGVDEIAVQEFMDFIIRHFLDHEGMHIVEHILLRPVVKTKRFDAATTATLIDNLSPEGSLFYVKTVNIVAVNTGTKVFTVSGNVTGQVVFNQRVTVQGSNSGLNDRTYTVMMVTPSGSNTNIKVLESISDNNVPFGTLGFTRQNVILNTTPSTETFTLTGPDPQTEISSGDVVIVAGSRDGANDRRYITDTVTPNGGSSDLKILQAEIAYEDRFLKINETADCKDCRFDDPYSFVVSVILPYWQGRFSNQTFRRFVEKTIRMECPAHIVINFCWVDCRQMALFEEKYKKWLLVHSLEERDEFELNLALNELLDAFTSTRSVYPRGTLHDCDTDDQLKNSIILNRSILGNLTN